MQAPFPDGAEVLEAIFRDATDAIVVTDARGHIERVSRSVEAQLGWKPAALLGQNVRVLVPEPHASNHDDYMRRYRETGRTWILGTTREFDVRRGDGSLVPCELSISRIDTPGRSEPLFCGIFRNITERRAARRALRTSEAKFQAVFRCANQMVLLLDASGRVIEANESTFRRTGCTRHDILGKVLDGARLWSPEPANRAIAARALARAFESGLWTARIDVDLLATAVDGSGRRDALEVRLVPTAHELSIRLLDEDGEGMPHALVEVRDISGAVRAEEQQSAVIRSLARVGEEAAVLAHELRAPVSELELALKAVAKALGEEESAILESLAGRMKRLETLLSRTLRFSAPLEPELRPVHLDDVVRRLLDREQDALRRATVTVSVRIEPDVPALLADPTSLEDLLSNLVRNAVEAQEGGGALRIEAERSRDGEALLAVEDDGPGIPAGDREDVFRIFRSDKEGGTGIGLALVKKIADAHGASVELKDAEAGSGLRAELRWPTARTRDTQP